MKKKRYLNIKGAALDKEQLQMYMEKMAVNNETLRTSNIETYPIDRLNDNFRFIQKTYTLLNEHIKKGISIYPAGEWLLDNFYLIEETVKNIRNELTQKKYKNFPGINNGLYKGFARIYVLATEIVAYTDNKIDEEILKTSLLAYERKKTLNMEEIWNLPTFLELAIIENIRGVCEKIYVSQIQKYKVEEIVERLIEKKETNKQEYKKIRENTRMYQNSSYPFIEYMSYKLKKYGKIGNAYLNILEEQVNKLGLSVSEVIRKEHFDIAIQKVAIGNGITSIREIARINFLNLFEEINGVESLLKQDPANVYEKMDYKTKEYYRAEIKKISQKTKMSEIYIAKKTLELANKAKQEKKKHIGYYLIDRGRYILNKELGLKYKKDNKKAKKYIISIYAATMILSLAFGAYVYKTTNLVIAIISTIFAIIPISEIYVQTLNYILVKAVNPKILPKLSLQEGIPIEYSTMVVIPTIINTKEKVEELFKKMEIYYLANKEENIYFTLLGDCTASKNEIESFDKEVIEEGLKQSKILNEKYAKDKKEKFYFLYRNRVWSRGEKCYLGWERKRGMLCQFNEFLITGNNKFKVNTIKDKLNIKYIITLDADTNLVLESAKELIGTMAHILNKPILDKSKNIIIDGHALVQPRVGVDLTSSRKSLFAKIYAGAGGTDFYTNAISDVYQDNFGEGIFTGKGIYDLELFHKVLYNEIPENTVLSHDLLEGSYLRCGLATDILVLDGFPSKYNSYIARQHRWIRGDWQIATWCTNIITIRDKSKKVNPLNSLSKFKILDNLRRSLVTVTVAIMLIIAGALEICNVSATSILILAITTLLFPTILDIANYIIFKKSINSESISAHRNLLKSISGIKASIMRGFLEILFLPSKAYSNLNAIVKTIYRMNISKQNLLEWMTSEEAERQSKNTLGAYYKNMLPNLITSAILIVLTIINFKISFLVFGVLFAIAPIIAWYISQEEKEEKLISKISKQDEEYCLEIAKRTWKFFEENINEENNYLPPDNYQEDRKEKIAHRTSPTNIGLGLLTVCSSYDLGFITLENAINIIKKMLDTIERLSKWNGHLYNWYNTLNLAPLTPRYISTVDSGNFVGYLYTLKEFILETTKEEDLINRIDTLINNTNFAVLYDSKKRIFSIGFNIEENKITDSYYDLLASEARQASLIAIAKKDVPLKHWSSLSRTLTTLNRYKGLISWSGTAFEYLMPNINIKTYKGSLLDESCRFMIMSQKEYAKKLGIPWGISEAAFNLRDLNNNYQYKAFGIPWLGLKRGLEDDMVVSAYGIFLSMIYDPKAAIENLKQLEKQEMYGEYGFYESIDYTISRLKYGKSYEPVKTYMAHHQGLILLSINNLINDKILVKRFSRNPEIEAIDILLQERMPDKAIITKESKEKVEKLKLKDYENYTEKIFTKTNTNLNTSNVISNGKYTVVSNLKGIGYSQFNDILINRYKETADYDQGIFFYIKNLSTKEIYRNTPEQKSKITFSPDKIQYTKIEGNIEVKTKITVAPEEAVEIRRLELTNNGNNVETLEVTGFFEPVLSTALQDYAHTAFNNLFLTFKEIGNGNILIKRKKRGNKQIDIYAGVALYTEGEIVGDLEYELDKEKFMGKGNFQTPESIKNSKPFSKSLNLVTDPILAIKRTVKVLPGEIVTLDWILSVGYEEENVSRILQKYLNSNTISKTFELSKAKTEAEAIYFGLRGKDIEKYQKMLSYLIFQNPMKKETLEKLPKRTYSQSELWKFGISGDLPILSVKIKDVNDIHVIRDCLKAIEFFRSKNIKIDLVILNEEKNSYEHFIKFEIENEIQNKQLAFLKNIFGGIFVINEKEISQEDRDLLEFRSNLILNAALGNIDMQLKDLEEEHEEKIKNIGEEEKKVFIQDNQIETISEDYDNLKYYNDYGGFSEDELEYRIKINKNNKLPTAWSNILANPNFGTIITQNLGGFTWNQNSRLNRISAWNNSSNTDIPSEIIYIKNKETGEYWSLCDNITVTPQEYHIKYGFGYVIVKTIKNQIIQELESFVAKEDRVKVNIFKLKNTSNEKKNLKILYYIKPVLGEDETQTNGYIYVQMNNNVVTAENLYTDNFKGQIVYCGSSEKIKSFTGSKDDFIGQGKINKPKAINTVNLGNQSGLGENSCIAIELEIQLEGYESKELVLFLGEEENLLKAKDTAYKYSKISNVREELNQVKRFWYELLTRIQVKTPLESMNIMLNGWAIYQTIVSRLWARTGYYQSGGAIGFRDQLQDTLGLKYIAPELMKNQILIQTKHQFIEGDVEHWWHEETKRGIRTRFSDDLLWLCYVVSEYIEYTGDKEFLNIEVPYLQGEPLEEGIDEKYDLYLESDIKGSIYEHCIKAIEKSLNFGENGLPKIGSGDWNDGLNTVGNKKKGESVWLGFFLYEILKRFIPICEEMDDHKRADKYDKIREKLKKALNSAGWDGRWFKRAFTDEGEPIGSIENEECRIDSISQSWGVISGAADNDKKYISMESLENHLIDKENGIIKLLDPPFNKTKMEPGYIKAYLPGVRENGGQYTHAAMWAIIAFTKLGFGDKALEYYRMINPIEHSRTKETALKYKVEPYVIPADIYGAEGMTGRGGWTWYTGSSSWFYKAGIENILGLNIKNNVLKLEPCIPRDWKEYIIKYRYKNSIYNIKVKNENGKNTGVEKLYLNGQEVKEKQITLNGEGGIYEVEVYM